MSDDIELAIVPGVSFLSGLHSSVIRDRGIEAAVSRGVAFLVRCGARRVERSTEIDLAVEVGVFLEARGLFVSEGDLAVGLSVPVAIFL